MRTSCANSFALGALAFATLCMPPALRAQFLDPAPAELKMTADPKAPGAAAVYLYREETTDDTLHFHSYYERIKVLTEKGKELATVRIPYEAGAFTVTGIQGRTVHADGTVIPLTATPSDLTDFKSKTVQLNTLVFTLPAVEIGSIIEYRLSLTYALNTVSQPTWNIQQPYFVRKAHYSFFPEMGYGYQIVNSHGAPLDKRLFSSRLGPDDKVVRDKRGAYILDVADVPPAPEEDWMPPLNAIEWRVHFYYSNFETSIEFWADAGDHWAEDARAFTSPAGSLKKAAAEIVAPGDTEEQKAAKLYAAVMKLDNTGFSRSKTEAERKREKIKPVANAEDVWRLQSGSADDIARLYVALVRAAGLKAWPMQVVDRSRAMFDDSYLSMDQLDDYIAIVSIDGKDVYLDPGEKLCPFGRLHWKHTLASGFRLTDKGFAPATTPAGNYKLAAVQRIADLNVDALGNVQGTLRFVMTGPEALRWRQLTLDNDADEVKKQFNDSMRDHIPDGVTADFDHFIALDDYNSNLIGVVKVSGSLGSATGRRFILPALFFESRARHPFVAEDKRVTPIDVHYPMTEQDDVTYHLPPGFTIESAPQPANATWPTHAVLKISSTSSADSINVLRSLTYNYTLLDAKAYPDLHDFYQKVATADQQQIVLTRATAAKGN
jgi:Domain of Unknown Function with PDB structure (DUF3857)/Transglutaminase-like superfamily